ncbi:MAG: RidA family protein [Deltaproteobacteria bacterium]|nr:RidA family protein [Deltaproteobacteria bacterium]
MAWRTISTGSTFEQQVPYSRALFDDDWVFVSGTTGFDYPTMSISDDVGEQARRTWKNIADALEKAGSNLGEIVQFLLILPNPENLEVIGQVMKAVLPHKPTGTVICANLADPRIKVEIQVTAKRQR